MFKLSPQNSALSLGMIFLSAVSFSNGFENLMIDYVKHKSPNNGHVANVSDFMDDNIHFIRSVINMNETMQLPNKDLGFASAKLYNGELEGLETFIRTGNCSISYSNKTFDFNFTVGYDELLFAYNYSYKLLFFQREGKFDGSVQNISVTINARFDFAKYLVSLERFNIDNLGKIDVRIEDIAGEIKTIIVNYIITAMKTDIKITIERSIIDEIEEIIKEINKRIKTKKNHKQFKFVNLVE